MATKKSKPKEIPFGEVRWTINNLRDEELAVFDENPPTVDRVLGDFQRCVEDGWSFSIKWDTYSDKAVQVSMIQKWADKPNAGCGLSARSPDLSEAMALLWYKFFVIAETNLSSVGVDSENLRG